MPEEKVSILVQIRDQISRPLNEAENRLRDFGSRINELSQRVSPFARAIGGIAAGFAGFAAARRAVQEIVAFEQGLVGVAKTANLTDAEMQALGDEILALAQKTPVAVTELLSIAQAAGQLGIKGSENLLRFTDTVARLGVASDLAGEEAATTLARLLSVTGESVQSVGRLASAFVALGNNFAATEREIALTATQVAQATAVFGVGSAEAAGFGAALRQLGVRAELSGSAIGKTFRALDAAVRGAGSQLQTVAEIAGTSAEEFARVFDRSPVEGVQLFVAGLGRVIAQGGSAATTLESLGLAGEEINRVLPTLAVNSDVLARALLTARIEADGFGATIERVFKTLESAVDRSGSRLDRIAQIAGTTSNIFSETFATAPAQAVAQFVEGLARLVAEGDEAREKLDDLGLSADDLNRVIPSLATNTGVLSEVLGAAGDQIDGLGNALLTESERGFQTFGADLERLKNSLFALNVSLGESGAKGAAQGFVGVLAQAISIVAGVDGSLASASDRAIALARAIEAVTAAAVAWIATKILAFIAELVTLIVQLGRGFTTLTAAMAKNPFGLLAVAISTLVGSLAFFTSETTKAAAAQESFNERVDEFRRIARTINNIQIARRAAERTQSLQDDIAARQQELNALQERLETLQAQAEQRGPRALIGRQEQELLIELGLQPGTLNEIEKELQQVAGGFSDEVARSLGVQILAKVRPSLLEALRQIDPAELVLTTNEEALDRVSAKINDLRLEIEALQQDAAGTRPAGPTAPDSAEARLSVRQEQLTKLREELQRLEVRAQSTEGAVDSILTPERTQLLTDLGVELPPVEVPVSFEVQNERVLEAIRRRVGGLRSEVVFLETAIRRAQDAEKFAPFLQALENERAVIEATTESEKRRVVVLQQARAFAEKEGFSEEQTAGFLARVREEVEALQAATDAADERAAADERLREVRESFTSLAGQVRDEVDSLRDEALATETLASLGSIDDARRDELIATMQAERIARAAGIDLMSEEYQRLLDLINARKRESDAVARARARASGLEVDRSLARQIEDEQAIFEETILVLRRYGDQIQSLDQAIAIAADTHEREKLLIEEGSDAIDEKTEAYRRQRVELETLISSQDLQLRRARLDLEDRREDRERDLTSADVAQEDFGDFTEGASEELQDFANQVGSLQNLGGSLASTFVNGLGDLASAIANANTNWTQFAANFLSRIALMIAQALIAKAILSAIGFSGGGEVSEDGGGSGLAPLADPALRAEGGPIPGPDVRRDVVHALLTPKEWVIQRDSVLYYGDLLMSAINERLIPKPALMAALSEPVPQVHSVKLNFQSGGPVSSSAIRGEPEFGPTYLPNDEQTGERLLRGGLARPLLRWLREQGITPNRRGQ